MKNLTIENIIAACHGNWHGDSSVLHTEITAVTADSRTVQPGCLFAAIPGERVDGHNFLAGAFEKGALCALVNRIPEGVKGNFICVPETIAALQALAGFYRTQFDVPVLGITGSVGKTTAKDIVASVLSQHFPIHKTAGNFNNDLGVPLTLFGLNENHYEVDFYNWAKCVTGNVYLIVISAMLLNSAVFFAIGFLRLQKRKNNP